MAKQLLTNEDLMVFNSKERYRLFEQEVIRATRHDLYDWEVVDEKAYYQAYVDSQANPDNPIKAREYDDGIKSDGAAEDHELIAKDRTVDDILSEPIVIPARRFNPYIQEDEDVQVEWVPYKMISHLKAVEEMRQKLIEKDAQVATVLSEKAALIDEMESLLNDNPYRDAYQTYSQSRRKDKGEESASKTVVNNYHIGDPNEVVRKVTAAVRTRSNHI